MHQAAAAVSLGTYWPWETTAMLWSARRRKKVKEADLYSAFIEVPYTQGAQVRITQCYLQTTPYLPLPRKHSPDGASQTEVVELQPTTHLSTPKG